MNNWAIWILMGAIGIFQWGPPVTHPSTHPSRLQLRPAGVLYCTAQADSAYSAHMTNMPSAPDDFD